MMSNSDQWSSFVAKGIFFSPLTQICLQYLLPYLSKEHFILEV